MGRILCALAVASALMIHSECSAQSLFGSGSGGSGGSSGGASRGGGSGGGSGSNLFGGSGGSSNRGSGTSGRNNSSMGGGRTGGSGSSDVQFNAGDGSLRGLVENSGFVGQGNANDFFGAGTQTQQGGRGMGGGFSSGTRGGSGNMFSGLRGASGGQRSGNNFNSFRSGRGNNTQQTREMRPQIRLDLESEAPISSAVTNNLQLKLSQISSLQTEGRSFSAVVDSEGVATISGDVRTEYERRLLESFVRMDPNVYEVKNELIVLPEAR